VIQLSSRGFLYAPHRAVCSRCSPATITIADAPWWCRPRTNQPSVTESSMCATDAHASVDDGA
jgi:hypothetical protein